MPNDNDKTTQAGVLKNTQIEVFDLSHFLKSITARRLLT